MADWWPVANAEPGLRVINFLDMQGTTPWQVEDAHNFKRMTIQNGGYVLPAGWPFSSQFTASNPLLVVAGAFGGGFGSASCLRSLGGAELMASSHFSNGPTATRFAPFSAFTRMSVFSAQPDVQPGAYFMNMYSMAGVEVNNDSRIVVSANAGGTVTYAVRHQTMSSDLVLCTEPTANRGVFLVERWRAFRTKNPYVSTHGLYTAKAITANGLFEVDNESSHLDLASALFAPRWAAYLSISGSFPFRGALGSVYFAEGWASDAEVDRLLGWGLHRWGLQSYAPIGWVYRDSRPRVERKALFFGSGKLPEPVAVTLSARNNQVETGKILGLDSEVKDADGEVIINASPTLSISQGLSLLGSLHDEQGNTEFLVQAHTPGTFTLKAFYAGLESPSVQFSAVLPPEPAPIDTPTPPAPSEPDGVESTIGRIRFNGGAGVRLMFGSTRIRISGGMVRKVVPPKQPERPVGNPFKRQGRNR